MDVPEYIDPENKNENVDKLREENKKEEEEGPKRGKCCIII